MGGVKFSKLGVVSVKITIGILSWESIDDTKRCLESVYKDIKLLNGKNISTKLVVVDNGSNDGTQNYLRKENIDCLILNETNLGQSIARNQIIKNAEGEYLIIFDCDIMVIPNSCNAMVEYMESHPDTANFGVERDGCTRKIESATKYIERCDTITPAKANRANNGYGIFRMSIFTDYGVAYDENLGVGWGRDDDDLGRQIVNAGFDIESFGNAIFYHNRRSSWRVMERLGMDKNELLNKRKLYLREKYTKGLVSFSVCMANHNCEKYISEAIGSVLSQTVRNFELIIVDDGSTDNSINIIKSFDDERIKLIEHDDNKGYAYALATAMDSAVRDIIVVFDSDDVLRNNALEVVSECYKKNSDCGFVYSQFMYCDEYLKPVKTGYCKQIPEGKTAMAIDCVSHLKTFKRKDYLKSAKIDRSVCSAVDKHLVYIMEEVTNFKFVDEILYYYRHRKGNMSEDKRGQKEWHKKVIAMAEQGRDGN